jgi:hypothetical protein
MAVRAPHLYQSLRNYCLGAFKALAADVESGADLPFAFEEHALGAGPTLYEYRPLPRGFVEQRLSALLVLPDAKIAMEDLLRAPSAAIYARAHAGAGPTEEEAIFRSVLLPLLSMTAERCGGFDWHDDAFDRAYEELESTLFGSARSYAAIAPLVGLSTGAAVDLGDGIRVRVAATGELANYWPEAQGLLPERFGREADRLCVIELARELEPGEVEPPDAPGELADALTALRLVIGGPVAAGPVIFERLDWRPLAIRPMLPIAATPPPGEPSRLDPFRAKLVRDVRERLPIADGDPKLADALDRWELSLFQEGTFRKEQLRAALESLLGGRDGHWAASLRAAVLLASGPKERAEIHERLREAEDPESLRRAIVETLLHGSRGELVTALDETILGLRPKPAGYLESSAA